MVKENIEQAVKDLLFALDQDVDRPGLKETPRRVAKYWMELLEGEQYTNEQIAKMYKKDFQVPTDSMVIKECNNVFSHCEHHLALMYNGTVYVAYIPAYWNGKDDTEGYRVIGLSKIPRIVEMCSKRLQLQEKLCADIAECIHRYSDVALGIADIRRCRFCYLAAFSHLCILSVECS